MHKMEGNKKTVKIGNEKVSEEVFKNIHQNCIDEFKKVSNQNFLHFFKKLYLLALMNM